MVYAATLLGPGGFRRPVALKVLTTHRAVPTDLIEEARLGAMLQHPNLVSTWEVGEADGRWFLAMELVRGPTVRALAASTRRNMENS